MNPDMSDSSRRAVAFFRWLLRFYPAAFRRGYEEKLILLFQDQLRDAKARKMTGAMVRFWGRMVLDTGRSAGREYWSEFRQVAGSGGTALLLYYAPTTFGRRLRTVAVCALLVSLGGWWVMPLSYRSTARIMLQTKDGSFDPYVVATAIERVAESQTLERVLGPWSHSTVKGELSTLMERNDPIVRLPESSPFARDASNSEVDKVRRNLRVIQFSRTAIIEIWFTASLPDEAASMANRIAFAFLDRSRERGGTQFDLVDPAIPGLRPITPRLGASLLLALVGGFVAAGVLELLLALARRSERSLRTG